MWSLERLFSQEGEPDPNSNYPDLRILVNLDAVISYLNSVQENIFLVFETAKERKEVVSQATESRIKIDTYKQGKVVEVAIIYGATDKDAEAFASRLSLTEVKPTKGWRVWSKFLPRSEDA